MKVKDMLVKTFRITQGQLTALGQMGEASINEHVRRAIDLYLLHHSQKPTTSLSEKGTK